MEKVNTLVIGGGAVGLAIGCEISKNRPDVVVVDKETSFGKHTSSRNSEVIHAGHYYPPGSLKASLCVEGNKMLYAYLQANDVRYSNTGKIIVATNPDETAILDNYLALGKQNGCQGMILLDEHEVRDLEPLIKCVAGLFVPSTGIFDTHGFMQCLEQQTESQGGYVIYGMEVCSIHRNNGFYMVCFTNGETYQSEHLINSAGLWADQVAALAGMDTGGAGVALHLCKGEYYKTSRIRGVNRLVYPVADPHGIFLGIHLTLNLNGEIRFGPNAYYVDEIDYKFNGEYLEEFHKAIMRYLDISTDELMPDDTGIRPKLQGPGDGFRDFYIQEETARGLPGLINLIGIESPGLTASLAIAKHVKELTRK